MDEMRQREGLIRFGPFEFDPASLELRRRGVTVRIQGQPLQILALLLSRPGTLVTRETLQRALWTEETFVDFEHALNAAVRRLRRALEDEANAPRFIQTLARRGYRFIGAVDSAANRPRSNDPRPSGGTIAVLPFSNLTGDDEVDYLVEGITDRLINELALIHDLRVMARSAVFRYKGSSRDPLAIGRSLGVHAVMVGTVSRRNPTTLSIHAELVDVAHGFHL
jgi:DNA-binding winged helix-turn-helix (wHTH) protein